MLHPIRGYYFDRATHCVPCTQEAAAVGLLKRVPPLSLTTDANGVARDLRGRNGEPVGAVCAPGLLCADCGGVTA